MRRLLPAGIACGLAMLGCAGWATAAGVNLTWDDCGSSGSTVKTFACDANTGAPFSLYASFIPPGGIRQFLGLTAELEIFTGTPAFVDWWAHGAGRCRGAGELSTTFDFTGGSSSCTDFYGGLAAGGLAYDVGFSDVDRARLRVSVAVPIDNLGPVDPGTEYYAFRASFNRAKSTGVGSCAGCSVPACIVLNEIQLFQVPEAGNDPEITSAAGSNHVLWQSSTSGCAASAGGRTRSWGQLKSLYR